MQEIALTRAKASANTRADSPLPSTENPETETIVGQNERFAVVESYAGEASQIARETDPRSQAHRRARRRP
jgi:hypothetical protein